MTPRFDWLSPPRRTRPLVGLALALTACPTPPAPGDPGPDGPPGVAGDQGVQGAQGDDGAAWLVDATTLDRGSADCPYGGVRYDAGYDDGSNGGVAGDLVLQAGEIEQTDFVCHPAGTFAGFEVPDGPAGLATIDLDGGSSPNGAGGYGGEFFATLAGTGGHIVNYTTGWIDDAFELPSVDDANLGDEPLVVAAGTTLSPRVIQTGEVGTLVEGEVFQFADAGGSYDENLYRRQGTSNIPITGVRIEAGAKLEIARDPSAPTGLALVGLPFDLVNAGTLSTPIENGFRVGLVVAARNYFGTSTSHIDLAGAAGTATDPGSQAGSLTLVAHESGWQYAPSYASGGYPPDYCPPSLRQAGTLDHRGLIDVSAGALGATETLGARPGQLANLCAGDEVFLVGAVFARGVGFESGNYAGTGGIVYATAYLSVVHAGAIDVRGGVSPYQAARGGRVRLNAAEVLLSGTVDASSRDVPAVADCVTNYCSADTGGSLEVYGTWGGVRVTGAVDLHGGDGLGAVGYGYGGWGGNLTVRTNPGTMPTYGGGQPGPLQLSGDIDLHGGDGRAGGGRGGSVALQLQYDGGEGVPVGQGITLYGYQSIHANGGSGAAFGGGGGYVFLIAGEGSLDGGDGVQTIGGSAVNYVPIDLRGGQGLDGAEGGQGGFYFASAQMNDGPTATAMGLSRAPVHVDGGAGGSGGSGGFAFTAGAAFAEIAAPIFSTGGAASGDGGTGGDAGFVAVLSQYEVSVLGADATVSGGPGFYGGEGGAVFVYGPEANVVGNAIAPGGAGDLSGGIGGSGGRIDVWSADTWSVITGTLDVSGAAGLTPGVEGEIRVDGFIEP